MKPQMKNNRTCLFTVSCNVKSKNTGLNMKAFHFAKEMFKNSQVKKGLEKNLNFVPPSLETSFFDGISRAPCYNSTCCPIVGAL